MKIRVDKRKVKGKEYELYRATLTKREYHLLQKLGNEFKIKDVDPKGFVELEVKRDLTVGFVTSSEGEGDPQTSFNVYDRGVLEGFKEWCRGRGLSMCQALNDFMRGVVEGEEHLGDVGGVKIVNVFLGKPRSKRKRLLWSSEFVGDRESQR